MPESWRDIADQIKRSLTQKKSIGFHKRHAFHDNYGCIFKIENEEWNRWKVYYISIEDNSIKDMCISDSHALSKFEIVSRGYMPGCTIKIVNFYDVSEGDSDAVKETWRIADEHIPK